MSFVIQTTRRWLYRLARAANLKSFRGSSDYWDRRYSIGGDSGVGSYGPFAAFKAETINEFVAKHNVASVIEFGSGDGNQLTLAKYKAYLGIDVSEVAVAKCRERFRSDPSKRFELLSNYNGEQAEVALSLDVIYHLVEDEVFDRYMQNLFSAATRYVVVYASNKDIPSSPESPHVRHREFMKWVSTHRPEWTCFETVPNKYPFRGDYRTGSFADFYFFSRTIAATE